MDVPATSSKERVFDFVENFGFALPMGSVRKEFL